MRYLEAAIKRLSYADWKLVWEALRERAWMLNSHPYLCHPLPILIPVRNLLEKAYYGFGIWLYDKLSYPQNISKPEWLSKVEVYEKFPTLISGYVGGWQYWDGHFVDRLYAVHVALFLRQRYGVEIRTHAEVVSIIPRSQDVLIQARLKGGEHYETRGDYVINATGPWADNLRRKVRPGAGARLRLSRGSHLVLSGDSLSIKMGFLIPKTRDGRLIFVLPWLEGTVLVGTTEEEVSAPIWPAQVSEAEEEFLRQHLRQYFDVEHVKVQARFAGYRPLVARKAGSTARLARTHVVEVWPEERFISLMGGKWTTYRQMGEDAIAAIAQIAGRKLEAGEEVHSVVPDWDELEKYRRENPQPLTPDLPYTWGEVRFWEDLGWAQEVEDLVAGRWLLPFYDERKAIQVREILAREWKK